MRNKILFALTSHDRKGETGQPTGFYLPEAAHPWAVLKEAGFEVDFVSPKGGTPPHGRERGKRRDEPKFSGRLGRHPKNDQHPHSQPSQAKRLCRDSVCWRTWNDVGFS